MNQYTKETQKWLEKRYCQTDHDGIYFAHQPIYGFRMGHSEKSLLHRYSITYHIMKTLSHLEFDSLVDVGGSEGYKGALVRDLFNIVVKSCDLSSEACRRAREIYNLETETIDVQNLPFESNAFDVVLCSEVLEHVPDFYDAVEQLIRVCRKAVIITLPHESKRHVSNHKAGPHSHLRDYDIKAFDYIESRGLTVLKKRMNNHIIKFLGVIAEAMPRFHERHLQLCSLYNMSIPVLRTLFGKRTFETLIHIDAFASSISLYSSMLFVILKEPSAYSALPLRRIKIRPLLDFAVPYHFIEQESEPFPDQKEST